MGYGHVCERIEGGMAMCVRKWMGYGHVCERMEGGYGHVCERMDGVWPCV